MKTIYEGDLVFEVAYSLDCSKAFARTILGVIKANLGQHLFQGDEVVLTGFGKFHVKRVGAKTIRIPRTGKPLKISAGRCPAWQPSEVLKRRLRGIGSLCGTAAPGCQPASDRR